MYLRRMLAALLSMSAIGMALLAGPSASAATLSSHVRVWGQVSCAGTWPPPLPGPGWFASRVRFQAANGEAHDATISGINYYVDFSNVPAKGETVIVYITCNAPTVAPWGKQFKLTRHLLQLQHLSLLTH